MICRRRTSLRAKRGTSRLVLVESTSGRDGDNVSICLAGVCQKRLHGKASASNVRIQEQH